VGVGFTLLSASDGSWQVGDVYSGTDAQAEGSRAARWSRRSRPVGDRAFAHPVEALLDGSAVGDDVPVGSWRHDRGHQAGGGGGSLAQLSGRTMKRSSSPWRGRRAAAPRLPRRGRGHRRDRVVENTKTNDETVRLIADVDKGDRFS
jgi:hypothetical protein